MNRATPDSAKAEAPHAEKTYGTILKSSSIIGGSQILVYAIGLIKVKLIAVMLGTAGVGLIGIYNAIIMLSSTVTNMGLSNSGVREIATARSKQDHELVAEVRLAIFRLASILGAIGVIVLALLSPWVSYWLFGSRDKAVAISIIGLTLFFNGFNVAQKAIIQGHRRIGDLARLSIIAAGISTLLAALLYFYLGEQGIVHALVLTSLVGVLIAAYYSRRLTSSPTVRSWGRSVFHCRRLIVVGSAVAWGMLLAQVVPFYAKSLIVTNLGVSENGLYVAAFAISGLFANFVLNAMSSDYFPRLSAVATDPPRMNRLVNEQTEIGILVALPGVVAAFAFAPYIISILYTDEFFPATDLLRWFLIGVMAKVVNFPIGMIMLAKGDSKIFAGSQTLVVAIHIAIVTVLFNRFGLSGAAMAYGLYSICVSFLYALGAAWIYRFYWSMPVKFLLFYSVIALSLVALITYLFSDSGVGSILSGLLIIVVGLLCLRGVLHRVEGHPSLQRLAKKYPWVFSKLKIIPSGM